MTGEGIQIDAQRLDVDGQLAHGLHAVGVEKDAGLAGDARDLGERLHRSQLVVGVHDGDKHGLGAQGAADVAGGNQAVGGDADARHRNALAFELGAGGEHGRVLDGSGDDVLALARVVADGAE